MKKEVNKEIIMKFLKENLFGIIFLFFGVFLIYHEFTDDSSSSPYYYIDEADREEAWHNYVEDQMIEDLEFERKIAEEEERENAPLYYIDNGYYFHNDINCRGLDGYRDNLNTIHPEALIEHQELSPCNWCVKGNN